MMDRIPTAASFSSAQVPDPTPDDVLDVPRSCDHLANIRMTLVKIRLGMVVQRLELHEALQRLEECARRYPSNMSDGFIRLDTARNVLVRKMRSQELRQEWCLDAVRAVHDEIKMLGMLPGHGLDAKD